MAPTKLLLTGVPGAGKRYLREHLVMEVTEPTVVDFLRPDATLRPPDEPLTEIAATAS